MADLYTMQATFMIAMSFNIKGLFKQRFYNQAYMLISMIVYQVFIFYLLFLDNVSDVFGFMRGFNDGVASNFLVDPTT